MIQSKWSHSNDSDVWSLTYYSLSAKMWNLDSFEAKYVLIWRIF
jgi:hypothetical protein